MICPPNEAVNTLQRLIAVKTDKCVLWPYSHNERGYGLLEVNGILRKAHVVAWAFANDQPIPNYRYRDKSTLHVLHTCDVRDCVNPQHLFRGTQKENIEDMVRKGRWSAGTNHSRPTHAKVREIKGLVAQGILSSREIAEMYDLTYVSVYRIATGRSHAKL